MLWNALHVKLLRGDLEKGLQHGARGIIHQQVNWTDVFERRLRGLPFGQVHTHRPDRGTLEIKDIKKKSQKDS